MPPARLGLIGAGRWGRLYVNTIKDIPEATLAAVASTNPTTPAYVGPQCAVFTRWQELLDKTEIDGLVFATSPIEQVEIAKAAIHRGLAILLEKPVSLLVDDAAELVRLAQSNAAITHVDHIDLNNPALCAIREHIAIPSDVRGLHGTWSNHGPIRTFMRGLWDYGAHATAVCLDIMGRAPDSLEASWLQHDTNGELARLCLSWSGPTAVLEVGNAASNSNRWLEIRTSRHLLRYDDIADHKAHIDGRAIDHAATRPLTCAVQRFVAAIRRGNSDYRDLELGASVVRTLAAAQRMLEREN